MLQNNMDPKIAKKTIYTGMINLICKNGCNVLYNMHAFSVITRNLRLLS